MCKLKFFCTKLVAPLLWPLSLCVALVTDKSLGSGVIRYRGWGPGWSRVRVSSVLRYQVWQIVTSQHSEVSHSQSRIYTVTDDIPILISQPLQCVAFHLVWNWWQLLIILLSEQYYMMYQHVNVDIFTYLYTKIFIHIDTVSDINTYLYSPWNWSQIPRQKENTKFVFLKCSYKYLDICFVLCFDVHRCLSNLSIPIMYTFYW